MALYFDDGSKEDMHARRRNRGAAATGLELTRRVEKGKVHISGDDDGLEYSLSKKGRFRLVGEANVHLVSQATVNVHADDVRHRILAQRAGEEEGAMRERWAALRARLGPTPREIEVLARAQSAEGEGKGKKGRKGEKMREKERPSRSAMRAELAALSHPAMADLVDDLAHFAAVDPRQHRVKKGKKKKEEEDMEEEEEEDEVIFVTPSISRAEYEAIGAAHGGWTESFKNKPRRPELRRETQRINKQ